jgi:beta-phosphoglucomutase
MKKIKAAIFDMDGVVVDNHQYHYQAWSEFCHKHHYPLTEEIYRDKFNGKTNKDLFCMIFGEISPSQIAQYAAEKEGLYRQLYFPHLAPLKGLLDFLEYLKAQHIKLALGTSAPTENVDFVLDNLRLRQYFEVVVDGTQVERGKPDPQVYQMCVYKLGLEPQQCVVFEDSLAGLESGERAGCRIVAVATSHQAYELKPKTDLVIHDFTEARSLLRL